jgi:perosamine synthetase
MKTPVFSSYIRRRDMDSVLNCLVTDDLGPGAAYTRFMAQVREFLACEYVAGLRSPVEAVRVAVRCLGLSAGDGVACSAFSPAYYAYALAAEGLAPAWIDVLPASGAIDPEAVSKEGAKAAVISGPFGIMPNFEALSEAGLPLVEDISHTVGAYSSLRKAGESGAICVLSLEAGGQFTSGEGALVFARGKREAAALRSAVESMPRETLMSDMNASLGFAQLKEFPRFQERRKELFGLFQRALLQSRHGLLTQEGEGEPSYFAFPVVLRSGARDVRAYARKKEIETEEPSAGTVLAALDEAEPPLPQARALALRCVLFPLHPRIGAGAAQKIIKVLSTLP